MKILVISPHPDDETLGVGGTLCRYARAGAEIHWLNVTDMRTEYGFAADAVAARTAAIAAVARDYGCASLTNLALPPGKLDTLPQGELVAALADTVQRVRPETVFLPHFGDVHSDHRVVHAAATAATKGFRAPFITRLLMMEIPSETDQGRGFVPDYYLDISDTLAEKVAVLQRYAGELASPPFPRNAETVQALARVRGAAVGVMAAEACQLLRGRD